MHDLTATATSDDRPTSVERRFTNEVGNEILIEVALGDPGCFCRFCLSGPNSSIESYTTRMELEQLRDALTEALQNG